MVEGMACRSTFLLNARVPYFRRAQGAWAALLLALIRTEHISHRVLTIAADIIAEWARGRGQQEKRGCRSSGVCPYMRPGGNTVVVAEVHNFVGYDGLLTMVGWH